MTLELQLPYYDSVSNKTIVPIAETDSSLFVRIEARLDGNQTSLPRDDIFDKAMMWFMNRYIQAYANQKLDEKVREVEDLTSQMKTTLDEANDSIDKMNEQLALNNLSRLAQMQLLTVLIKKGVLTDEDMAEIGLFDVEDDDLLEEDDDTSDDVE